MLVGEEKRPKTPLGAAAFDFLKTASGLTREVKQEEADETGETRWIGR